MNTRNLLKPADYLVPVPVGLPIKLRYDKDGKLDSVFIWNEHTDTRGENSLLSTIRSSSSVPMQISITGGTTEVQGVFYSDRLSYDSGVLPAAVINSLVERYIANPLEFMFYAFSVDSYAALFRGAAPIRQWLQMAGFNVLPGSLLPAILNSATLSATIKPLFQNFKYPLVAYHVVFRGTEMHIYPTEIKQVTVNRVSKTVDPSGRIWGTFSDKNVAGSVYSVDYGDIITFNIHTNSLVVFDYNNEVIYSESTDNKSREKRSADKLVCDICGSKIPVKSGVPTRCPDVRCTSRLYPTVNHFLRTLTLPEMTPQAYQTSVNNGLVCVSDIFTLSEYRTQKVNVSMNTLIKSLITNLTRREIVALQKFINRCNNNVKTVNYYLSDVSNILNDANMADKDLQKLVDWFAVDYNYSTFEALLESPQIVIEEANKRFDGAPMFRNKKIMITGDFLHGTISDIASILRSYSAEVVTVFDESVNCVLVGSDLSNIDGGAIHKAKRLNIPVFEETSFFRQYEIDDDLKNLL